MSVAMSMLMLFPHEVHAQQQLLVACEFIKDVHAVNNLLAFEAKRCFAELIRRHVSPDAAVSTVASCKIFTFGTVPSTESNLPIKLR